MSYLTVKPTLLPRPATIHSDGDGNRSAEWPLPPGTVVNGAVTALANGNVRFAFLMANLEVRQHDFEPAAARAQADLLASFLDGAWTFASEGPFRAEVSYLVNAIRAAAAWAEEL